MLSEEERNPSVCPMSHSDSTPSQSEEEDEVSNSGQGKETSSEASKRTSANKSIRTGQPEKPGPDTGSLLLPSSHQHVGKRDFPPKAGRTSLSSSPHKCGSHDPQEERVLPALKNTHERETQNLQKRNQAGLNLGQAKGIPLSAKREKISPVVTENHHLTGNKSSQEDLIGQGQHSTACGRKDGGPGEVKGQEEIQRAPEQVSQAAKAPSHEETQLVWQNLDPALNTRGKQEGIQHGEFKHEKRSQAIWEGEERTPKGINGANQNVNKTLLGDPISAERALQLNLNGHGEHFEKVIGQPQGQSIRGSEDTPSGTELDNQAPSMKSQSENQINQLYEQLVQPECENPNGRPQEVLRDHIPFLASRKGPNSARKAVLPHSGSIVSRGKSLAGQERRTSAPSGSGKQPDEQDAKVRSQKKPQMSGEKTKRTPAKIKRSPGKALRGYADNLALSTSTEQDSQQPSCTPILEVDQQVNCPVFTPSVELSGGKGNHLASADSVEGRSLKGQLPRISTEHLSFSNSSGLESPSLNIPKDPGDTEKFQKSQWPVSDQGEVTPWVGNQPGVSQTSNPTLNPSSCIVAVEADGVNCGPSGDHTLVPSHSSKRGVLSPKLGNRNENDEPNQRSECSNPLSSEDQSDEANSGSEARNPVQVAETQDLLDPATEARATLQEHSGGNVEDSHGAKEEQAEEEDEELSSFSSLLASKLSLSPHGYLMSCPKKQEDTVPSSPTKTGKPVSKTKHSARVSQDAIALLSKNLGAHPTIHRKRKSNTLGTRRSKRLRNQ